VNWKVVLVEVFAIVASYLVISMSVASAATVRTYSSTGTEVGTPLNFNPHGLVKKEVSVDSGSLTLGFKVSNGSASVSVERVWLYSCKDKSPKECMDSIFFVAESFSGNVDKSYAWSDISSPGSGYPQTAGLLYFVKLRRGGNPVWVAFWTVVERQSAQSFTVKESGISEIGVYAKDVGLISTIREFVGSYFMIPANPGWISRVVFKGANSMYEISLGSEEGFAAPNRPDSQELSGNEVSSVSENYTFILPVVSSVVKHPVALYLNPSYTCGMFGCESDKGEGPGNCCLDCPCSPGYYCDISRGCRPESGIALGLYGTVSPKVVNCYESHAVTMPVQIGNAPSGYSVAEKWCKLGGKFSACECTRGAGDVYVCSVVVPPVEDCGSGEFRISNNAIRFKIGYMDGAVPTERYIETGFPDVTVGSFVCGELGCETALGEGPDNCCYDCGCPSGYCDYEWGADPSSGACKDDPAADNIYIESMYPTHFYTHSPGDEVFLNLILMNKPKTISLEGVSSEMGCVYDGTEACEASSQIACSEAQSSDPERHNLSCRISFTISGYDNLKDYVLSPVVALGIKYRNGTGEYIEGSITKAVSQISIGAHWCGDQVCGEDENQDSCCYDCGCPSGQYCDTRNINGPTQGDGCQNADFKIVIDSIGSLGLVDSAIEHDVPVMIHVENYPSGTAVVPKCSLADGGVACSIACQNVPSQKPEDYNLSCTLNVPAIDYVSSPYYDSGSRKITLPSNRLNISLYYNDGYQKAVMPLQQVLDDVVIDVIGHCGEGGCEDWLGENQANCCRDCGCSGFGETYFCYLGASPNGECLDNSTINLRVVGFEPDPPECIIGRIGGDCKFIKTHIMNVHVIKSPPDLDVLEAFYQIEGENITAMDCVKTLEYGNWSCPFTPPLIHGDEKGVLNRSLDLFMSVSYMLNSSPVVDSISTTTMFVVSKSKSDALIRCEDEIERIQQQINSLQHNQGSYNSWGWLYYVLGGIMIAIGIVLMIACCLTDGCCTIAIMLIVMGVVMIVLGVLGQDKGANLDTQISQFNDMMEQKREICSSEDFEKLAEATGGVSPLSPIA
jgi:hypothetical protein